MPVATTAGGSVLSSIVIRAKNEARFIGDTLRAAFSQEDCDDFEVIIVDSGSTDATLEIVRGFPVTLIEIPPETFTYGRALNIGAREAQGSLIVSLSAHSLPIGQHWLRSIVEPFADASVCGVYGRQLPRPDASRLEVFGMHFTGVTSQRRRVHNSNAMFSNANGAIRRSLWEQQPFDELVPGAEDLAWVRDMLKRGYIAIFEPDACAYHSHGVPLIPHLKQIARDLPTVTRSMLGLGSLPTGQLAAPASPSQAAE
jgi:rhamnosyltransferase